jgi:transposase
LVLFGNIDDEETPDMGNGNGLAEAQLGLDGLKVLGVTEREEEAIIAIGTSASVAGCWHCGVLAERQDRIRVDIRDLVCFGRPARLVWSKRRWRYLEPECPVKTWTE